MNLRVKVCLTGRPAEKFEEIKNTTKLKGILKVIYKNEEQRNNVIVNDKFVPIVAHSLKSDLKTVLLEMTDGIVDRFPTHLPLSIFTDSFEGNRTVLCATTDHSIEIEFNQLNSDIKLGRFEQALNKYYKQGV